MPFNPGSTSCEGLKKLRSVVVLGNDGQDRLSSGETVWLIFNLQQALLPPM